MKVTHLHYDCVVVFGEYLFGNTAIKLIGAEGTEYEDELINVASVSGTFDTKGTDLVGIKTWSENEGIDQSLINANVIHEEVVHVEPSGFVNIHYHKLTDKALKEIDRQTFKRG